MKDLATGRDPYHRAVSVDVSGDRWRLGHRPALDIVRGLAILLVLVGHSRVPGLVGAGPVGVRLFFCLSGFLITALLLQEHARSGRISFAAFYARRAGRLMPALLASTALVALVSLRVPWFASWPDVLATVFYVGNWRLVATGELGALVATWSLAVEEQFYLVWPVLLLLALRAGRRWAMALMTIGLVGSLVARWMLWDRDPASLRLAYGTEMQVDALMAGALIAAAVCGRSVRARSRWWAVPALGGLLVAASRDGGWFYLSMAGWALVSSAALVAVAALVTVEGRASLAPLRWLGRRSYGIYLYHAPVAVALDVMRPEWPPWIRAVCILGVGLPLAVLSWRYLEEPILRRRRSFAARGETLPAAAAVGGNP